MVLTVTFNHLAFTTRFVLSVLEGATIHQLSVRHALQKIKLFNTMKLTVINSVLLAVAVDIGLMAHCALSANSTHPLIDISSIGLSSYSFYLSGSALQRNWKQSNQQEKIIATSILLLSGFSICSHLSSMCNNKNKKIWQNEE